jgi:conjugal transfer pilus assembly protein TraB
MEIRPVGTSGVKRKQLMLLVAGGAVLLAVVLLAAWMADRRAAPKNPLDKPVPVSTAITPGSQLNDKDVWRATEAGKVQALSQEIQEMKQSLDKLANAPAPTQTAGSTPTQLQPPGMQAGKQGFTPGMALPPPPPPPPEPRNLLGPVHYPAPGAKPPRPAQDGLATQDQDGAAGVAERHSVFTLEIAGGAPASSAAVHPVASSSATNKSTKAGDDAESANPKVNAENYLPPGTFMRVVMLSGLDAPTGGQAQQNPHPVLFRVMDHAQLPNAFRSRAKDCFITANAFGDISSERAYIRLDRFSCVNEDGGVVDVEVKGFVAGEDGKTGMRGRLVTKQGQVLANAFLAGIGSGLGQAFRESATTTSTSALGSTSTVTPGKEVQAGIGTGIGNAMDRLSKYYVQLAEKIFPVIEVDAGRTVDAVFTKGVSIERR